MRIAIFDPSAGVSGDMTLGALLSVGAPASWLEQLPARLGLAGVGVTIRDTNRCGVAAKQVEFSIPPQPHGRHVGELVRLVERCPLSDWVKQRAVRAFRLIGEAEGRVHGVAPEKVHLHEVGAVDAVLDVVGAIEGFERLGVEAIYNLPVAVGSGWVEAAHGRLAVPAPATALLLEGLEIATGGPREGGGTTPARAGVRPGLWAGGAPARARRGAGAGGGGRRWVAERATLPRRQVTVQLAPEVSVRVKVLEQPDAEGVRVKPEYEDVLAAAQALGRPPLEVARAAQRDAEALVSKSKE